jgi:glyoxylase-like metal-dependent hydrolase (beta-lactamase superfamily II)
VAEPEKLDDSEREQRLPVEDVIELLDPRLGTRCLDLSVGTGHFARPLAEATGARHLVPADEPADFDHETVEGGDEIAVGSATLDVVDTPGHTSGSASYLLDGEAVLTGDTLFANAVGRPDLEAEGRERARARALHASLDRLLGLAADTLVLPAHADRPLPFDGEVHGAPLGEFSDRIELLGLERDAFVDAVLDQLPETPANHETIVDLNRVGEQPEAEMSELEAGANRCAAGGER